MTLRQYKCAFAAADGEALLHCSDKSAATN
jgi:hypothetical protein